jgi:alkanesulfonate monooxygenase SsuD/methylene tetrahydromethanopterin reductase-like flavin-dependent oxidoreductase (luciferase family)
MRVGVGIDPAQALSEADEAALLRHAAERGYESAWTPSGPDAAAFDRCLRWNRESGLATGISVVPASGRPPSFYASQAVRVWESTGGRFVLGVGSGTMDRPARSMREYLSELRDLLPPELPIYVGAMGRAMLGLAGEVGDGAALNWCSNKQVNDARIEVSRAAAGAPRPVPVIAEYIRTVVDRDDGLARATLSSAMLGYALGPPQYRKHFERKGFAGELNELNELEAGQRTPSDALLAASGAYGRPGDVRAQFEGLAAGLDLAIVRVLVTKPGDAESARRVIEECAPA